MTITINGTTGITNDGGYTGDGVVFADTTPANTLVTTTGGNVGIGTSSPGTKVHVEGGAASTYLRVSSAYSTNGLYIGLDSTGESLLSAVDAKPLKFFTANTERARIDSSGNLLVGTIGTHGGAKFSVTSTNGYTMATYNTSDNYYPLRFLNAAGTVVGTIYSSASGTSFNTSSDYRLKENIQPMQNALAVVQQLNPVTYTWKADGSDGQGFIAHELQAVVPDCVTGEKDAVETFTDENGVEQTRPVYQGIDTSFLVATLTAAIQEQQAIITALTARVAALEGTQP